VDRLDIGIGCVYEERTTMKRTRVPGKTGDGVGDMLSTMRKENPLGQPLLLCDKFN